MAGKIAWVFSLGHGHEAQFRNFQESCPDELVARSVWAGMDFASSGDVLSDVRWVPGYVRSRRNEMWHFKQIFRQGVDRRDSLFLASWNLRFVPFMARFPSYLYVDFSPTLMRSLSPWYDHFFKRSALQGIREWAAAALPKRARGIFTMSRWCASGIIADYGIPAQRVHPVLPGANLRRWHFVDRAHRAGPVRVLMVGGEFERKGGDLLLEWAEKTSVSNYELDIVTWTEQLPPRVRALVGTPPVGGRVSVNLGPWLPKVTVHCGFRANSPELLGLFARADVFCLPTRGDFSSIASLEAMASGLPVIVGSVGGIPELIDDGTTGFLIERNEARGLAQRLEQLIEDAALRLRVGAAARQACERHLNVGRQLREIAATMDADRARD